MGEKSYKLKSEVIVNEPNYWRCINKKDVIQIALALWYEIKHHMNRCLMGPPTSPEYLELYTRSS